MRLQAAKRRCLIPLLLWLALWLPTTGTADRGVPVSGGELRLFDIYREGKQIGTHTVSRTRQGDRVTVEASTRISIRVLGFELYRLHYDARETWDATGLLELAVSVDDNGERVAINGRRQGDVFTWSDGSTSRSHAMPVYPTNHWNVAVLDQRTVLNTLTGEINRVNIDAAGDEFLELGGASVAATRYRYDGQLQLDSWYDHRGEWLAMEFTVEDGSTIRYQCRNCRAQASL